MVTAQTSNRLRQGVRIANMIRKRQMKQDPAVAHFTNEELDRAIRRAADALHASPRSGLRR